MCLKWLCELNCSSVLLYETRDQLPRLHETQCDDVIYSHRVQWTLCADVGEGVGDSPERMFNLIKFIKIFGLKSPFFDKQNDTLDHTPQQKNLNPRMHISKDVKCTIYMLNSLQLTDCNTNLFKTFKFIWGMSFYRNKWYGLNESNYLFLMNLLI